MDEETVHQLRKRLDEPLIVHGDGTKREVLREAGIEESESLIASTSNDETNLLICKTAKSLFSCRVITRVIKDEYTDLYKDIGTDVVVSDISATVGLLEKAAASNGLYGMITMGGKEGDVIEVDVADGSTADGSSIEDLDFPDLCTVGLIRRDSNLIPPRGDTVFEKGDQVVLVGKSEELISSIELFRTE
ncbi:MAG: potassium channel family protein [Candidatus Hadarchaeota archaeon]